MINFFQAPWPWYVAGFLIGIIVPVLLLLDNKSFGLSSSLRHICAACLPSKVSYFNYNWKKEIWNIFFILGIIIGAVIATHIIGNPKPIQLTASTLEDMKKYHIIDIYSLLPADLFSFKALFSIRGFICIAVGGFFVGFGTRYAGGCTSGHAIMGLSNLQWTSLVATISFMLTGILFTRFILPFILQL
jgi:uncharacterized membrane protein YedE/YeeE